MNKLSVFITKHRHVGVNVQMHCLDKTYSTVSHHMALTKQMIDFLQYWVITVEIISSS